MKWLIGILVLIGAIGIGFGFACALRMAKWKDEQHNEEKKELISLVNMLPVDDHNQTIIEDLIALLR